MSTTTSLLLIVTQGRERGLSLALDESPRIVGRSREADLVLTDAATSRRHLAVKLANGKVHVRTLEGTRPFLLDGDPRTEIDLSVGESITVGATVLTVTAAEIEAPAAPAAAKASAPRITNATEVTDVRALFAGDAGTVHELFEVNALIEALDQAADEAARCDVFAKWAKDAVNATAVALVDRHEIAAQPDLAPLERGELVVLAEGPGARVVVPAAMATAMGMDSVAAVSTSVPLPPGDLHATARRRIVIAARLFASSVAQARRVRQAEDDAASLRRQAFGSARGFLGESAAATQVAEQLPKLAASDATVLLLGESGVGKTFFARLLHEAGGRAKEPLRVLNCAAVPENLVESELFGHERGAFDGAGSARAGVFEGAARGTVLLDEIGELPLASQAKLLRVLEDQKLERLGARSNVPLQLRARILAATNVDLERAVANGTFRRDLHQHLAALVLRIPPLRDRGDDVQMLAERILADLSVTAGRRIIGFEDGALALLRSYSWPGNVRELRNVLEHAVIWGDRARIGVEDFPDALRLASTSPTVQKQADSTTVRLPAKLDWLEARAIEEAMRATGGNRTRAAAVLGINRTALYKKLKVPS